MRSPSRENPACRHIAATSIRSRAVTPSTAGCEECLTDRRFLGASAAVPRVRPRRLLRQLEEQACDQAFSCDRTSGHALARTGRDVGLVLTSTSAFSTRCPGLPARAEAVPPLRRTARCGRAARKAARSPSTRKAFRRVFPGVMVAMFLAAADQTILASALPTIASSLGGITDLSWVVVGYLLAATVAAPLYGYLGDRFGRRRGSARRAARSSPALRSPARSRPTSSGWCCSARLQGLGGGGLMTLAQALIGEHVSPRGARDGSPATLRRCLRWPAPPGRCWRLSHRALSAGAPCSSSTFRSGLLAAAIVVARAACARWHARDGPFRPDARGRASFCVATATFLYALSSGGHRFAWASWPMFALLAGALARLRHCCCAWERRHHDPVIPIHFLRSRRSPGPMPS